MTAFPPGPRIQDDSVPSTYIFIIIIIEVPCHSALINPRVDLPPGEPTN